MEVEIRPANHMDLLGLISRTEFASIAGAEESLRHHMLLSEDAWIGKIDGELMIAWGVIPPCMLSSSAYVWVLVADALKRPEYKFIFARYSQRIKDILLQKYDSLFGYCYPYQQDSLRWIKFLGAEFRELDERNRIPFKIRRK
jgi:hypothetical protein